MTANKNGRNTLQKISECVVLKCLVPFDNIHIRRQHGYTYSMTLMGIEFSYKEQLFDKGQFLFTLLYLNISETFSITCDP